MPKRTAAGKQSPDIVPNAAKSAPACRKCALWDSLFEKATPPPAVVAVLAMRWVDAPDAPWLARAAFFDAETAQMSARLLSDEARAFAAASPKISRGRAFVYAVFDWSRDTLAPLAEYLPRFDEPVWHAPKQTEPQP